MSTAKEDAKNLVFKPPGGAKRFGSIEFCEYSRAWDVARSRFARIGYYGTVTGNTGFFPELQSGIEEDKNANQNSSAVSQQRHRQQRSC